MTFKKLLVITITLLTAVSVLTGCELVVTTTPSEVEINFINEYFPTYEDLKAYAETLDPNRYQILYEVSGRSDHSGTYWVLCFFEKETNKTYEIFEFREWEKYSEFKKQIPDTQARDYLSFRERKFIILVNENTSSTPSTSEHEHSWYEKNFVTYCTECGKIEQKPTTESHSHTWDVKNVDGEIISFCTECGETADYNNPRVEPVDFHIGL